MSYSKMTKAQLVAEIERLRNEPCGMCGMTLKEWEETPLLDFEPVESPPTYDANTPIFIPTVWPASGEIEESDDFEDDE